MFMRGWIIGRSAALAVALALLGACETGAQRQLQAMRANSQSASAQVQGCMTGAYAKMPDIIKRHVPFSVTSATLEQLSDQNFATDDEVSALLQNHPAVQSCRKTYLDQISQSHPSVAAMVAKGYANSENSLVDLIQKKKSWGEHLRYTKENYLALQKEIVAEDQRITAGLKVSHDTEIAQRQAAANAFNQYYQTQQIIQSMNRPIVTNCNKFGNTTNCISQ